MKVCCFFFSFIKIQIIPPFYFCKKTLKVLRVHNKYCTTCTRNEMRDERSCMLFLLFFFKNFKLFRPSFFQADRRIIRHLFKIMATFTFTFLRSLLWASNLSYDKSTLIFWLNESPPMMEALISNFLPNLWFWPFMIAASYKDRPVCAINHLLCRDLSSVNSCIRNLEGNAPKNKTIRIK